MQNFKVIQSKPTKKPGLFFTKIQSKAPVTTSMGIFGQRTTEKQETYYVFGNTQMPVNGDIQLDINQWVVEQQPFTLPETGEVVQLKYLVGMK